jgi:hypothetical protein
LELLQPFLDRVACIQGKVANPREQPTDCDKHPGKYDPSHRPHPRYIFMLCKSYHYIFATSLKFVVKWLKILLNLSGFLTNAGSVRSSAGGVGEAAI